MRLITNKKGQVRVIEAFFASMLILSCLALIPAQTAPKNPSVNLNWKAQNILTALDSQGQLARLVDAHDWTKLGACIESALPLTTWFNLTVYDQNQKALNDYPISNGGSMSNTVTSYDYICVSQNSTLSIYILQLQLAVMD
jgi:hypothetical protein